MDNELAVSKNNQVSVFETIMSLAPVMHRARLFGVSSEEQAAVIMLKGHEIGLGFAQSFEFINVIKGKPSLIPRGALALVYMSGELESFEVIEEKDSKGKPYSCTVKGSRAGRYFETTFTMDDARNANLVKADSAWTKYQANMLRWRSIGYWIDFMFPDTQGGMKRADEFGAWVDSSGDVIDAEIENPLSVDSLIDKYDAEKVMNAIAFMFHGEMPKTQDDLELLERTIETGEKDDEYEKSKAVEVEASEA